MELRIVAIHGSRVSRTLKWMRHLLSGNWPKATKCVKIAPAELCPDPPSPWHLDISSARLRVVSLQLTHAQQPENAERPKLPYIPNFNL